MVESLVVPFLRICKTNIGRILISSVICLVLHLHFSLPLLIRVFPRLGTTSSSISGFIDYSFVVEAYASG
jgi:hypothetical protein